MRSNAIIICEHTLKNLANPVDVKNQLVVSVDAPGIAKQRLRIGGDLNFALRFG